MNENVEHDRSTVHRREVTITPQSSKVRTWPKEENNYHSSHILYGVTKSSQGSHSNLDDWLSHDSESGYTNGRTKTDKNENEKTADTMAKYLCETTSAPPLPLILVSVVIAIIFLFLRVKAPRLESHPQPIRIRNGSFGPDRGNHW